MPEEEPSCPYKKITEECKPKCESLLAPYEACVKRITASKEGDCEAWNFDFWKCIDKCRGPKVMKFVK